MARYRDDFQIIRKSSKKRQNNKTRYKLKHVEKLNLQSHRNLKFYQTAAKIALGQTTRNTEKPH